MKTFKNIIIISNLFLILSCSVVKEGFQNPKKKSSDEFLVEKKSPLVMPPEFNKLPIPGANEQDSKADQNTIKDLLINNESKATTSSDNPDKSLEKTLLEKIKKN